jgi:hypothetical protein
MGTPVAEDFIEGPSCQYPGCDNVEAMDCYDEAEKLLYYCEKHAGEQGFCLSCGRHSPHGVGPIGTCVRCQEAADAESEPPDEATSNILEPGRHPT